MSRLLRGGLRALCNRCTGTDSSRSLQTCAQLRAGAAYSLQEYESISRRWQNSNGQPGRASAGSQETFRWANLLPALATATGAVLLTQQADCAGNDVGSSQNRLGVSSLLLCTYKCSSDCQYPLLVLLSWTVNFNTSLFLAHRKRMCLRGTPSRNGWTQRQGLWPEKQTRPLIWTGGQTSLGHRPAPSFMESQGSEQSFWATARLSSGTQSSSGRTYRSNAHTARGSLKGTAGAKSGRWLACAPATLWRLKSTAAWAALVCTWPSMVVCCAARRHCK